MDFENVLKFSPELDEDVKIIPIDKPTASSQEDEDYQCGICSVSFNTKSNLLDHVQLKHGKNKKSLEEQRNQPKIELKSCGDCGTKCQNDFDLYKHHRNGCQVQKEEPQNVPENIIQENQSTQKQCKLKCSKCGLNFKFRIQLIKHSKIHHENHDRKSSPFDEAQTGAEKSVSKNRCKKPKKLKTKTKFGLEEYFSCPKSSCNFQTKYKRNMKSHLRCTHGEGGKILKCDLCPFQTVYKWNMKEHQQSHLQEKPFVCSFPKCDFRSHRRRNLQDHEALHNRKSQGRQGRIKIHRTKKSAKRPTLKILPDALECRKKSEKLVQTQRASSRRRNQVHHSLCEETLVQDFSWQDPACDSTAPVTSSDLKQTRISKLSRYNYTDDTAMSPPLLATAPQNQAQQKCNKRMKEAIKAAGLTQISSAENLQCPHCPYHTKTQWLLRGHMVGHGAAEPFSCPIKNCNFQSKWQNLLYSHMRNVHSTRYIPPGSKRKLKAVKESTAKSSGGCTQPKELGRTNSATKNVVPKPLRDPKSNLFLCPVPDCGFKTLYDHNMPRHVQLHKKIRSFSYACPNCYGKFANAPALGWHKRSCCRGEQRSSDPAPQTSSSSIAAESLPKKVEVLIDKKIVKKFESPVVNRKVKWYTCPEVADCNYKTRFRGSFLRHRECHDKFVVFPYSCKGCQRKFPTKPALLIHGHKCYTRNPTNQTTAKINSKLSSSIVAHTKYEKLVHNCTGCQRKFATVAALRRHGHYCTGTPASQTSGTSRSSRAPKTTNRNTFKCPQCPYLARDQYNLNRHLIKHTDERPFACLLCPYTGRYSWTLKEHHQRHHPGRKFVLPPKVSWKGSCAKTTLANDERADYGTLATFAHNTATVSNEDSAPGGCTFCSYKSRLGMYLTKHMATRCPGCHKSTNHSPPSSTSAPEVPSKPRPVHAPAADAVPNYACMLCSYVAASESHALDHSRMHKTAVVALKRLFLS